MARPASSGLRVTSVYKTPAAIGSPRMVDRGPEELSRSCGRSFDSCQAHNANDRFAWHDATGLDRNIRSGIPIAIPTSAIEGWASLIPSPTNATLLASCSFGWPSFLRKDISNDGVNSAYQPSNSGPPFGIPVNMTVFKPVL